MTSTATLQLDTELLIYHVAEVKAVLDTLLDAAPPPCVLTLDAGQLVDLDGAGMQLLALLQQALQPPGGGLRWQGLRPEVADRIREAGLATALALDTAAHPQEARA